MSVSSSKKKKLYNLFTTHVVEENVMPRMLFFRSQVGPAKVNLPVMPHVASVPKTAHEGKGLWDGLAALGASLAANVLRQEKARQAGFMEEAYITARAQMAQWTADYERDHQGGNALEAQAAYETQWQKISLGIREQYAQKLAADTQVQLARRLELGRIRAMERGAAWQALQTRIWQSGLDEKSLALLYADIADDPANTAFHEVRLRDVLDGLRLRHPDRDMNAQEMRLRQNVAEAQIDGLLDRGDADGAQAMLQRLASGTSTILLSPDKTHVWQKRIDDLRLKQWQCL